MQWVTLVESIVLDAGMFVPLLEPLASDFVSVSAFPTRFLAGVKLGMKVNVMTEETKCKAQHGQGNTPNHGV